MRLIIKIILTISLVISTTLILSNHFIDLKGVTDHPEVVTIEEEIILTKTDTMELIKMIDPNYQLLKEDLMIQIVNEGQIFWEEEGRYICSIEDDIFLYLVLEKNQEFLLYKITRSNWTSTFVLIEIDQVNDLIMIDNYLWVIGSNNGDAIIIKMTKSLYVYVSYQYGGIGYESFLKILETIDQDQIVHRYLVGEKDAHCYDGPFKSVGSKGEKKLFLAKIDYKGSLGDIVYFNEGNGDDQYLYANINSNIELIIRNQGTVYGYLLNLNLKVIKKESLEFNHSTYLFSNSGYLIGINNSILMVDQKELSLNLKGEIYLVTNQDNSLVVYSRYLKQLLKYQISEYHIDQLALITINKDRSIDLDADLNLLPEIKINSYLSKLKVVKESIDPYFSPSLSGKYTMKAKIVREGFTDVIIDLLIEVSNYDNVTDQGVYGTGFTIDFNGYANILGQAIFTGYVFNTPGEYLITFKNNLDQVYQKKIYIVEGYLRPQNIIAPLAIVVANNQVPVIKLEINPNNLEAIIVNQQRRNVKIIDNQVYLELPSKSEYGLSSYCLEQAVYNQPDHNLVDLNVEVKVLTLRAIPQVMIKEIGTDVCQFMINISDPNFAIVDLFVVVYHNQEEKVVINSYLSNQDISFNSEIDQEYDIVYYLTYDLGDGIVVKEELISLKIVAKKTKINLGQLSFKYTQTPLNKTIENAIVTLEVAKSQLELSSLEVATTNLTSKYQLKSISNIFKVSIGITVIIILFDIFLILKKKTPIEKTNQQSNQPNS